MLLSIVAKPYKRDKFEVTPESVAYLSALVSVSEEVRSRCHLKFSRSLGKSVSSDTFPVDLHLNMSMNNSCANSNSQGHSMGSNNSQHPSNIITNNPPYPQSQPQLSMPQDKGNNGPCPSSVPSSLANSTPIQVGPGSISSGIGSMVSICTSTSVPAMVGSTSNAGTPGGGSTATPVNFPTIGELRSGVSASKIQNPAVASPAAFTSGGSTSVSSSTVSTPTNRRQKSWDTEQSNSQNTVSKQPSAAQQAVNKADPKTWRSLDLDPQTQNTRPLFKTQRSSSMPTPKGDISPPHKDRSARVSVSNENNVLLDPEVLTDFLTQALVLTAMATLVKYTTDENEMRVLYEYLAEASIVFPKVFPVIHSLLDAKITSILAQCHDGVILSAVQAIIENMIACEDQQHQQLHQLQSCGFGGLWRFAGPFTKSNCTAENAELFVNCLEAMVETSLPGDGDEGSEMELAQYPSMLSVASANLSSSMSSLTLASPTEKDSGLRL